MHSKKIMFETFVRNKTDNEKNIIGELDDFSKESIIKSRLSDFSKNYVLNDSSGSLSHDDLISKIEKSNKLYFNYTIRPKWTLLNFLFGKSESRPPNEVIEKLKLFPFYNYYGDAITEFIKDNSLIFITRREVTGIIDETNKAILNKLTNETTNLKIKNFFLQIFRLKYEAEPDYNLESAIPFSFIKLYLEDKTFSDLNDKFNSAAFGEQSEIMLKDIIKIMTDKYRIKDNGAIASDKNETGKSVKEKIVIEIPPVTEAAQPEEEKIYSEELLTAGKNEAVIPESEEILIADKIETESKEKEIAIEPEPKSNPVAELFDEKQHSKILNKIFASDRESMDDSFDKLADFKNWKEASGYLKKIFFSNNVDLYEKNVVEFVNKLNDYFKRKE